ncbi:MAG TPA: ATP-binding protein [Candidatus Baltobacteraceae bacterium]|nr:ATP-binding protein [Candidatus Baltobacteraceae bacterium]
MATVREETHESRVLQRLFEITQDILQAQDAGAALDSIARGLSDVYGFKYVSIVASDRPGGEMHRRVLIGFPEETVTERLGEHIPREAIGGLLLREFEVVPHCYYIPAERDQTWAYNIYVGEMASDRARARPNAWHEHDSLTLVLADPSGEMIGYVSVDGPLNGRVPPQETLRQMQLFVNLVGLALGNARGRAVEVERRQIVEQASRTQSEFLGVVSHEVRSPLSAIRGATVLLEAHFDSLSDERRRELLGVLTSSTSRLSAIFEDFLLLSRMDAGKLTLRFEPVDPIAVVEESVARIESQHPSREFRTFYLEPLPPVRADEGRLVQVLTNILSNAAKYSTDGSVIAVEIKAVDEGMRFAVKNEGPGVPESERDKIFTRFGRIGRDSGDASIGLGLYICSELVSLMGGRIGFESVRNKVTTFWFTLPRAAQ